MSTTTATPPQTTAASEVTFDSKANQSFWESNQSDYFGARHAKSIVFLSRGHIGETILDAGAGDGSMVRALRSMLPNSSVVGIDLAPKAADVHQGDLMNMPYQTDQFDTVFFMEVIEHLTPEDSITILSEIRRVLKPGGSLVLTTPYDEKLEKDQVQCPCCKAEFHRYGHQQRFMERDIAGMLSVAGLNAESIFPVKMARVRRYKFMGPKFFQTEFMKRASRKMRGKRNLIAFATKPVE